MANTGIDTLLVPEFWAGAFDELDTGQYPLKNLVNRKYESAVASSGATVHVPLTPNFAANDYDGFSATSEQDITQTEALVSLDKSKETSFILTNKELSLTPYELIQTYGVPAVEAQMEAIEVSLYKEFIKSPYFTDATGGFTEDVVVDMQTALSNRKISKPNRKFVGAPDEIGALMKADVFQQANTSGTTDVIRDGFLGRRFGLDFFESNGISTYTPLDLVGTVTPALTGGETTVALGAFADAPANDNFKIRSGDIIVFAGEAGTPKHTIISVLPATGNTTSVVVSPAVVGVVADISAATITPTRSGIAFSPNAVAFAARPYATMPEGTGVRSTISTIDGMPIRISVWHSGALGVKVQFDSLFGHTLIDGARVERAIID